MPTALVTGASSGIGATYADRLARRGHDLVLVARDATRLETLTTRLRGETGRKVDPFPADLTDPAALRAVEDRLSEDAAITLLVNNAGTALPGGFTATDADRQEALIRLNVTAPTRLARAALPRLLRQGGGAIVNIASVLALAPELMQGIYPATKAYMLTFSQSLQAEFGARGLYVQAVLPAATRTEIWSRAEMDLAQIPGVMDVNELVDAALIGFDRREPVTIPPLPEEAAWTGFEAARLSMHPQFRQEHPARRYRA